VGDPLYKVLAAAFFSGFSAAYFGQPSAATKTKQKASAAKLYLLFILKGKCTKRPMSSFGCAFFNFQSIFLKFSG
jgi:hypothetical protein